MRSDRTSARRDLVAGRHRAHRRDLAAAVPRGDVAPLVRRAGVDVDRAHVVDHEGAAAAVREVNDDGRAPRGDLDGRRDLDRRRVYAERGAWSRRPCTSASRRVTGAGTCRSRLRAGRCACPASAGGSSRRERTTSRARPRSSARRRSARVGIARVDKLEVAVESLVIRNTRVSGCRCRRCARSVSARRSRRH